MKRAWRGVPLFVWMMLGILALAAGMLTLSQSNAAARPSAGSTAPSGLRIWATLLRESGFAINSTRDPQPLLKKQDVPVVILLERPPSEWFMPEENDEDIAIRKHILRHVEAGGTAIVGGLSTDFRGASVTAKGSKRELPSAGSERNAQASETTTDGFLAGWPYDGVVSPLWWAPDEDSFIDVTTHGKGQIIYIRDWIIATNRFITEADHAPMLMSTVRQFVPKASEIVFMESTWGNARSPGLFERLGPAFASAWAQVVVLILVVVYTLGRPFGLPAGVRPRQAGQRDLVDATASFFRRANATDIALDAVLADARHKILTELKLSRATEWGVWSLRIPESLRHIYREVELASKERIRPADAIKIAAELDREVTAFIGKDRLASRRRIRRDGTGKRGF